MNNWIEWKGGNQPVEADVMVDVRFRRGHYGSRPEKAGNLRWSHEDKISDITAFRLHQPQQDDSPMTIEQFLTKANRHAAKAAKHERKRAELVGRAKELVPEGWELREGESIFPKLKASLEEALETEMTDPANWKAGDVVECVEGVGFYFTKGREYRALAWSDEGNVIDLGGDITAIDNEGDQWQAPATNFRWISRPQGESA